MVIQLLRATGIVVLLVGMAVLILVGYGAYTARKLPFQPAVFEMLTPPDPGPVGSKGVLIFTKTNGFRHESIAAGIVALQAMGRRRGWHVVTTENGAFFNHDYLRRFKVVVFLSTSGDVLTHSQEQAFERYMERGGGYVGIHAAMDTETDWDWYHQLLSTGYQSHTVFPHTPNAEIDVEDQTNPATVVLPWCWFKADEWYSFTRNPRTVPGVHVLMTVNERTFDTGILGGMGPDHPISWTNRIGEGRVFYTGLGHTSESFRNPLFLRHLGGGIEWVGRLAGL